VSESSASQSVARLRALVRGRVQGVFFRAFTRHHATRLGLAGWVRNLPDANTVEVVAEGPSSVLEQLVACLREGPPEARVTQVDVEWDSARREFDSFQTR